VTAVATPTRFLTIADMARRLSVPRHKVVWIIATRGIRHAAEIGEQHGYDEASENEIRAHIAAIHSSR